MSNLVVLFEHAVGYALFNVKEFEEVGALLSAVEKSVIDIGRFSQIVKLKSFVPFSTALDALDGINCISEGIMPATLQTFLELNFPKVSKKSQQPTLGVGDVKLAANISEELNIKCTHAGAVPEILRGIRIHFHHLVKNLTDSSSSVGQLGLSHSYSRAKIKFNVNRADNMIIQAICLLDQLDKNVNTFSMRIREWYGYHFPELFKLVPDIYLYARVVKFIENRESLLTDDKIEELESIVMDPVLAKTIVNASRTSMGINISPIDLLHINMFAERLASTAEFRNEIADYLKEKMKDMAPNLAQLLGESLAARLISRAGSLTNLAKFPASTIQIIGAEKALFRAIKTKSNTPKYGILYNSSYISRASLKNKGRISRFLANKCTIASRIDCFSEDPVDVYGKKLRQQMEDRLKYYETGEIPPKNIDVMGEAVIEINDIKNAVSVSSGSKKKKRKSENVTNTENTDGMNGVEIPAVKKSKKKHKTEVEMVTEEVANEVEDEIKIKKKSKKKPKTDMVEVTEVVNNDVEHEINIKKKSKKKKNNDLPINVKGNKSRVKNGKNIVEE